MSDLPDVKIKVLPVFPSTAMMMIDASTTPTVNGQMTFQATSNTSLTIKYKGSDGIVRSANITLA